MPQQIVITNLAAFADGGTICLCAQVAEGVTLRICLSPVDSVVFMGRKGELYLVEHGAAIRQRVYNVVARSELEEQVIDLLRSAECQTSDLEKTRDKIVTFVESEEYVRLAANG